MCLRWCNFVSRLVAAYSGLIFKFKLELEIVVMSSVMTTISTWTWKSIQNKKESSSTILGTHKSSYYFTLAHQTCKLDLELKLCEATPAVAISKCLAVFSDMLSGRCRDDPGHKFKCMGATGWDVTDPHIQIDTQSLLRSPVKTCKR